MNARDLNSFKSNANSITNKAYISKESNYDYYRESMDANHLQFNIPGKKSRSKSRISNFQVETDDFYKEENEYYKQIIIPKMDYNYGEYNYFAYNCNEKTNSKYESKQNNGFIKELNQFEDLLTNKQKFESLSPTVIEQPVEANFDSNLLMSKPSTVFSFKDNVPESTTNKLKPNFKKTKITNSNVNTIENFFTCKKLTKLISKQKSEKVSTDIINFDDIDINHIVELELENLIKETSETKAKRTQPNTIVDFPLNFIIKHEKLNSVQEICFDLLVKSDMNSIICSPTGSGKTTLFELAICRIIYKYFDLDMNKLTNTDFKIVYLAPIKSLCQEKFFEWKIKFAQSPFNLSVIEATGDSEYVNIIQLIKSNIIISTPERWDIITRKWKEYPQFIFSISLLLIDEVHLLNEEQRGATLEAIIARMKFISNLPQFSNSLIKEYRMIALSATIPNMSELAEFLNVDFDKGMKNFGEEYRPVKIEKLVLGFNSAKNEYLFEKYLNYRLADTIVKYSDNRPTLVFCQTQKGTINAANQLLEDIHKFNYETTENDHTALVCLSQKIKDKNLSNLVKHKLAFHNAGLGMEDRQLVEENFKKGIIKIICTTSTLAQGVNLPARLVIIKSTFCYRGPKIGYNEYSKLEIEQMIGRAGRPQYDTKGIAVIMTEKCNVDKYIDMTTENIAIESRLKENLIEHINSEITQGAITDIESAVKYLKNTFMYIRMKNHPEKYNIRKQINVDIVLTIDEYLSKMFFKIFNDLKQIELINIYSLSNNESMRAEGTSLGRKMCKYYIRFETLKEISEINSNTEEHIINVLSNSFEFSKYHSKLEDRKVLNELNKSNLSIKYKIKGSIDTASKKAFILLQSALSGINIDQWELRRQQNEVVNCSVRILNCIKEYYKLKNDATGYINSIILKKGLNQRMWSDSDLLMKQLPKIGEKLAKNFIKAGLLTFEKIVCENPRKIEAICGKNTPFGNILIDLIKSIPVIEFKYEIIKNYKNTFKLCMNFNLPWKKYINQEDFDPYTHYHVLVNEVNTNKIIFKKKLKPSTNEKIFRFNISCLNNESFPIKVNLLCDKFFGLDKNHFILNSEDKLGSVTNNFSSSGQITLYQLYDRLQTNNSISNNKPKNYIDDEIQNIINNELEDLSKSDKIICEDKPKKKNKKILKEKENDIKKFIGNMKKSVKTNNISANSNDVIIPENKSHVNNYSSNVNPNTSGHIKISNNSKLDFINKYESTIADKENNMLSSNLNFLDNYKLEKYKNKEDETNSNMQTQNLNNENKFRFTLNFNDFL